MPDGFWKDGIVYSSSLGCASRGGLKASIIHAVLLHRNADQLGAIRTECSGSRQGGSQSDRRHLRLPEPWWSGRRTADAGQDEQLIVLKNQNHCVRVGSPSSYHSAAALATLGQTVLQNRDRRVLQRRRDDVRNLGHREGLCGRVAAAERDHVRIRAPANSSRIWPSRAHRSYG